MDDRQIVSMFRQGYSLKTLTNLYETSHDSRNKEQKINKVDAQKIVETAVYMDYMRMLKQSLSG